MEKDPKHNDKWRESVDGRIDENQRKFLEAVEENPNIQLACKKVGISRSTIYRWREENQFFWKKLTTALDRGSERMNDYVESKLFEKIKDGDWPAIRFRL